jgi:hypothetical protein
MDQSLVRHFPAKKKKKKLGVEKSWQGYFLFLARYFSWVHYAGAAENRNLTASAQES